jgi:hypothetical protein
VFWGIEPVFWGIEPPPVFWGIEPVYWGIEPPPVFWGIEPVYWGIDPWPCPPVFWGIEPPPVVVDPSHGWGCESQWPRPSQNWHGIAPHMLLHGMLVQPPHAGGVELEPVPLPERQHSWLSGTHSVGQAPPLQQDPGHLYCCIRLQSVGPELVPFPIPYVPFPTP